MLTEWDSESENKNMQGDSGLESPGQFLWKNWFLKDTLRCGWSSSGGNKEADRWAHEGHVTVSEKEGPSVRNGTRNILG